MDFARLRRLPSTSLGAAYARHRDDNGITTDPLFTATIDVKDPGVAYRVRRTRQAHDEQRWAAPRHLTLEAYRAGGGAAPLLHRDVRTAQHYSGSLLPSPQV